MDEELVREADVGPGRDGEEEPVSPARVAEEEDPGRFGGDTARDRAEVG